VCWFDRLVALPLHLVADFSRKLHQVAALPVVQEGGTAESSTAAVFDGQLTQ
jgi:hypothetical protein